MSRPPEVIRIKRKRDDESPLAFLELDADGNKRARSTNNYVYKRRITGSATDIPIPKPAPVKVRPTIQASAPGDEIRFEKQLLATKSPKTPKETDDGGPQRTFHISKADTERLKSYSSQSSLSGMKRRHNMVVFVERDTRKMRVLGGADGGIAVQANSPTKSPEDGDSIDVPVPATPSTQQRRQVAIPVGRLPPPESLQKSVTPDLDRMADVMSQWAKEVTEKTPAAASTASSSAPVKKPMTRFRPKPKPKPAVEEMVGAGLAEGPSLAPAASVTTAAAVAATLGPEDDDSDYVEEEYHIVDPRAVPTDVPRHLIGRLVIDTDEQEYFYEERNTQMTGYDSDDSDENAENHYGNDYPDQELESDSEENGGLGGGWGTNMYTNEEFDEDMAMSDFGDEDWTQVREADFERDVDAQERDAKILERIRRFNQAVNRHGGY